MSTHAFSQLITFLNSQDLEATRQFYCHLLGFPLVRDQSTCLIFKATQNAYLGFCEHIERIPPGRRVILTLVSEEVDQWFEILSNQSVEIVAPPQANHKYGIYHFFFKDPDNYWIEIQKFDTPLM